jgi:C4-type Zn-finger protein
MGKEQNTDDVICDVCFTKNSIKTNKQSIPVGDKQGSYAEIFFDFCEECGHRHKVDWWD